MEKEVIYPKWWKNNRKLENNRKLRYWSIFLYCIDWIRIFIFSSSKENRRLKGGCLVSNCSYRIMKKSRKNNEMERKNK